MGRAARAWRLNVREYTFVEFDESCPKCISLANGRDMVTETIEREIGGDLITFNASLAMDLALNKPIVSLDGPLLELYMTISGIHKPHTKHVSLVHPGLLVRVQDGVVLIDGHHRGNRCLELGIPFNVYVFNEKESESLIVKTRQRGSW